MFLQRNRPRSVLRRKLLFMITVFLVGGTIFLYSGYRLLRVYRQRLEQLKEEVRVLEEKKRELTEEIEARENDPFYLEKLAREMGLIKDGEVIYRIREGEE